MEATARQQAWAARWGWVVIAVAVLLTYWPLASFQWAIAHGDTLNCWLPWRWFISSCLNEGRFPLWNAHQQFGYPMHADLQGPAWYVEAIALGGTIGQGIHVLQGLCLLYVMIGGWGMSRLSRTIQDDSRVALIIGVAYALGGFFTGHQQHFYAIISAAWLPWLLDAFVHLLREPGWRPAARVALFQGLLLTGGNHTFTIISAYLLLALLLVHAWSEWRSALMARASAFIRWGGIAVLLSACIAAGPLHSWWETSGLLSRGGTMAYDAASVGAFTEPSLISLFFPYATGSDMDRLGTDPPMANAYMGALILAFALTALLRKRSRIGNALLVFGTISAFAAFGDGTPVHHWLWRWLPGMDLFRFPSYFRWFTWLAVLVLAGGTLRAWFSGEMERGRAVAAVALMAVTASFVVLLAPGGTAEAGSGISFFERMRSVDLGARVMLAACVSVAVLIIAAILAWKDRLDFGAVLLCVVLEMGWNSSLALWNTGVSDIEPAWISRRLDALSTGPIIPERTPTSRFDDNGERLHYLAHNTQDFIGGFSRNGVNSFWLRSAMELEVSHPSLWNAMAHQPVAYLADSLISWEQYERDAVDAARDSGLVVLMPEAPRIIAQPRNPSDEAVVTGFSGDAFTIACRNAAPALLVLQQSSYPGWEAAIDGSPALILQVNIAAMAVQVPAGQHEVVFRYSKPIVPWLLALSLITLFALLFALAMNPMRTLPLTGSAMLLAMTLWSLLAHAHGEPRTEEIMNRAVPALPDHASVILNDDGSSPMPTTGDMVGWRIRADRPQATGRAWRTLRDAERHRTKHAPDVEREIHWFDAALRTDPAVRAMILDRYSADPLDTDDGRCHLRLYRRTLPVDWKKLNRPDTVTRRWLHADASFGSGLSLTLDSLIEFRDGELVVDLWGSAPRPAEAVVIFECRLGDRVTDYRALPIAIRGIEEEPCYARLPLDEVYRRGQELKIYLWSNGGDSLQERAFRVRAAQRRFVDW